MERINKIGYNYKHPTRKPLHNMVATLMEKGDTDDFKFNDLIQYFTYNYNTDRGEFKEETRLDDHKITLANEKTNGNKIPLQLVFSFSLFGSCLLNHDKTVMANKIIQLLGPYTRKEIQYKIQNSWNICNNALNGKLNALPDIITTTGGYRKRKTHRKTRKTRKTRK